jgi:hypothetical protein
MDLQIGRPVLVETARIVLAGKSRLQIEGSLSTPAAQTQIARHLTAIHDHIMVERLASFTVDLRKLAFVNSSAIRLFVDWISRAEGARYKLVFLTDHSITWHRLSFSVLKSLAPSSVEIL